MKLINRPVNRIFAFGCSFTKYFWSTWPEIIAYDLDVPFYNYGKSGGGNQYITNSVVQANAVHQFTKDDLIIVSWTNVCREDRWREGGWVTPGNIYNQNFFDEKFVKEWADPIGYMVRDFASINLVHNLIRNSGAQYHMLSMCDIVNQIDQNGGGFIVDQRYKEHYSKLCELYKTDIKNILPSFFSVLWNNDIYRNKIVADRDKIGELFSDGHPDPWDHLTYLKLVFSDHQFKDETIDKVSQVQTNYINFILKKCSKLKKPFAIYNLEHEEFLELRSTTLIKQELSSHII
jgi:hypothetical protein